MNNRATAAGIYNYLLGGKAWSEADRSAAEQVLAVSEESRVVAQRNRTFLVNAVRYLARHGITQFLDIGSGLPDETNVHQIAQAIHPETRTVYVDSDPAVLPLAQEMIGADPNTAYVQGDLTVPREILRTREVQGLIDFTRPLGLLIVSVLHHVPDQDDPYGVVADLVDELPDSSYLVISHSSLDLDTLDPKVRDSIIASNATMRVPVTFRNRKQVARFFEGTELIDPGLVYIEQWEPGQAGSREPIPLDMLAGVALIRR
ncbi:SAM-dependent methyltransferase [Microbispora corallina]|uniref:SAM-dependent methyltransferase n=1 Tax=Microbispora corallina TaxID=83302 RepID=A0ABQ4GCK8_9ACTN|nr:SAM-dependent methyltransferase [Microbispora corallina]GIH44804.1 hypothetical protein Mco01_78040 [Microbispora corallina]